MTKQKENKETKSNKRPIIDQKIAKIIALWADMQLKNSGLQSIEQVNYIFSYFGINMSSETTGQKVKNSDI